MIFEYNLQFFAKDGEGGEKTEPATPKKLEKAREEGQAPRSQDMNTAVILLVLFGGVKIFGGGGECPESGGIVARRCLRSVAVYVANRQDLRLADQQSGG